MLERCNLDIATVGIGGIPNISTRDITFKSNDLAFCESIGYSKTIHNIFYNDKIGAIKYEVKYFEKVVTVNSFSGRGYVENRELKDFIGFESSARKYLINFEFDKKSTFEVKIESFYKNIISFAKVRGLDLENSIGVFCITKNPTNPVFGIANIESIDKSFARLEIYFDKAFFSFEDIISCNRKIAFNFHDTTGNGLQLKGEIKDIRKVSDNSGIIECTINITYPMHKITAKT